MTSPSASDHHITRQKLRTAILLFTIIRKNNLWKKVRVLVAISTCTYPHKSVYLSDHLPERGARDAFADYHFNFYSCPGKSAEGAIDHRRGCSPPAPDRREEPPEQAQRTIISPKGATEYITCLISNCLYLCRPFGTFHVVAQLPGVNTPVCGLSSLRDFRVSPHEMLLSRKPNYRRISRGDLDFPRTTINFYSCPVNSV